MKELKKLPSMMLRENSKAPGVQFGVLALSSWINDISFDGRSDLFEFKPRIPLTMDEILKTMINDSLVFEDPDLSTNVNTQQHGTSCVPHVFLDTPGPCDMCATMMANIVNMIEACILRQGGNPATDVFN